MVVSCTKVFLRQQARAKYRQHTDMSKEPTKHKKPTKEDRSFTSPTWEAKKAS